MDRDITKEGDILDEFIHNFLERMDLLGLCEEKIGHIINALEYAREITSA